MTQQQREYGQAAASGKLGDILHLLTQEMGRKGDQAYCTTGTGFLAFGRQVIPSLQNRIVVQSPEKCLNFGTDPMAGMLEWLGRNISERYSSSNDSGVHLILGDISAPRGGCVSNPSGKRRHASHTAGQDADVGFLTVHPGQVSPTRFHNRFDIKTNWWFLKKVFQNPFACIKVIFLDQRHIRALARAVRGEREWTTYHRFIRHMPGHKNHFHIRVGNGPGLPGCTPNARPELEFEEDSDPADSAEAAELTILDELKTRQSSSIEE
jgi:murein endopeptidase